MTSGGATTVAVGGRYGGEYWAERSDMIYYQAVDYIVRAVGSRAVSLIDVGTGNCPYLEWFDWIPRRVSIDIRAPYSSATVEGLIGNIIDYELRESFDLCLCLQVLEHVSAADAFAQRLTEIATTAIVSVPFKWPEGKTAGHVHDPVDLDKLSGWFGRRPNYHLVIEEPLRRSKHRRLVAIYDRDPGRDFGGREVDQRIRRVRTPA